MRTPKPLPETAGYLLELPRVADERGALVFVEGGIHVPFPIRRFFVLYDTAEGAERAHHAHKACHQVLIALSGRFLVEIDDGRRRWRQLLDRPTRGLHVPPMTWIELRDFTPGAVCGVLASEPFEEADYIRDYAQFRQVLEAAS